MDKYICTCCGGQINRATMTCTYCGTKYKQELDNVIRIETFSNPVRTLSCTQVISTDMFYTLGSEKVTEIALKELSRKLADAIIPFMQVICETDHFMDTKRIEGRVKLIQPVHKEGR